MNASNPPTTVPAGVQLSSKEINNMIEKKERDLLTKEHKLKYFPRSIKAKKVQIEKGKTLMNNKTNHLRRANEINVQKYGLELMNMEKDMEKFKADLPKEIKEIKQELEPLKKQLAEAKKREEAMAEKRAKKAATNRRPASVASTEKATKEPAPTPLQAWWSEVAKKKVDGPAATKAKMQKPANRFIPSGRPAKANIETSAGSKRMADTNADGEGPARRRKLDEKKTSSMKEAGDINAASSPSMPETRSIAGSKRKADTSDDKEGPPRRRKLEEKKMSSVAKARKIMASPPTSTLGTGAAAGSKGNAGDGLDGVEGPGHHRLDSGKSLAVEQDGNAVVSPTTSKSGTSAADDTSSAVIDAADMPVLPKQLKKPASRVLGRDRLKENTKGIARPTGKKRSASTSGLDDNADGSAKRGKDNNEKGFRTASTSSSSSQGARGQRRGGFNGLANHQNSCFSSVVIQLLDAALESNDLNALLGEPEETEKFGLTPREVQDLDKEDHHGEKTSKLRKKEKEVRATIKEAAKAGEAEKVSAALHLRSLLKELAAEYHGTDEKFVSPYVFQSVIAWGAPEDSERAGGDLSDRQKMSGETQQDCFEYFQRVLDAVAEDPCTADGTGMKNLFEVETEAESVCSSSGCGYRSTPKKANNNYHDVKVPEDAESDARLGDLLKESLHGSTDEKCPKCGGTSLTIQTKILKAPDNLVVRMNRIKFDTSTKRASKIETAIELEPSVLELGGSRYELSAVIRHSSHHLSIDVGHYTIFRKHGETWYLLDDKICSKKSRDEVKDNGSRGQSAMLLLKKSTPKVGSTARRRSWRAV